MAEEGNRKSAESCSEDHDDELSFDLDLGDLRGYLRSFAEEAEVSDYSWQHAQASTQNAETTTTLKERGEFRETRGHTTNAMTTGATAKSPTKTTATSVKEYDVVLSETWTHSETMGTLIWYIIRQDATKGQQYGTEGRDALTARLIRKFEQYVFLRYKELPRPPLFWVPYDADKVDTKEKHVRTIWNDKEVGIASLKTIGYHIQKYVPEQQLKASPTTAHVLPTFQGEHAAARREETLTVQTYDVVLTDTRQSPLTIGSSLWRKVLDLAADEKYRRTHEDDLIGQLIREFEKKVCAHSLWKDRKTRPLSLKFWVNYNPNDVDVKERHIRDSWNGMQLGIASRDAIARHVSAYIAENAQSPLSNVRYQQRAIATTATTATTTTIPVEDYDVVLSDRKDTPRQIGTMLWREVREASKGKPHTKEHIRRVAQELFSDFEKAVRRHSLAKVRSEKVRPPVPCIWVEYDPKKVNAEQQHIRARWGPRNLELGIASRATIEDHIREYLRKQKKTPPPSKEELAAAPPVAARASLPPPERYGGGSTRGPVNTTTEAPPKSRQRKNFGRNIGKIWKKVNLPLPQLGIASRVNNVIQENLRKQKKRKQTKRKQTERKQRKAPPNSTEDQDVAISQSAGSPINTATGAIPASMEELPTEFERSRAAQFDVMPPLGSGNANDNSNDQDNNSIDNGEKQDMTVAIETTENRSELGINDCDLNNYTHGNGEPEDEKQELETPEVSGESDIDLFNYSEDDSDECSDDSGDAKISKEMKPMVVAAGGLGLMATDSDDSDSHSYDDTYCDTPSEDDSDESDIDSYDSEDDYSAKFDIALPLPRPATLPIPRHTGVDSSGKDD